MTRRLSVIAVALATFVLAGCGGGGSPSVPANAPPGEKLFADNCATCHTLAAAHASGTVGPVLDHLGLSATAVEDRVRHGAAGMPAFSGQLSDQQITQVARFVAESSH